MKKIFMSVIAVLLIGGIGYGSWYMYSHRADTVPVVNQNSLVPVSYTNAPYSFSLRTPTGYVVDEAYRYQASPKKIIPGVKFIINPEIAEGTNLGKDTYVSLEKISEATAQTSLCHADLFFDYVGTSTTQTINGKIYSVASSSGAAAGNRYDETVYAFPGTIPCTAVRYFVHYSAFENYPEGSIAHFDGELLMREFDAVRDSVSF